MLKKSIGVGLIGLGNVGLGALDILTGNAKALEDKLGFPLSVKAICSRTVHSKTLPALPDGVARYEDWRELVANPEVDVVAELIGGTATAKTIIEDALKRRKSVVTANKELMALRGAELWELANANGVNIAMEASVAGGIPIHTVMREGIAGDRIVELYGILNGTSNFILTEIEKSNAAFD
ncbi:MAG: homoserine dehydrogenase, partial [Bryobacteraceae bacterium]